MIPRMKSDFSGEWVLNRADCALSPGADAMRSAVVRIDHRDPIFKYQAEFMSDEGSRNVEYELQADGREITADHEGMTITSCLRWDGDALVATWGMKRPHGEMTISFRHE